MGTAELRVLFLGVCIVLASGFVLVRWSRLAAEARSGGRESRRDRMDTAVKQTVRLLTGIAVAMLGVSTAIDMTDPEIVAERVPCSLIFMMIGVLTYHMVMRAIFTWLRDDFLSRWDRDDWESTHDVR